MTRPWRVVAAVPTAEGPLELRQRGERDFLIVIGGRVLMTSEARRSEEALAERACVGLAAQAAPRVLIAGLGMGYTLRAALEVLPRDAQVVVAELSPDVVAWCHGPLAVLTDDALADPRVTLVVGDVAAVIATSPPASFAAIALDLYQGPFAAADDRVFGALGLARLFAALSPGGTLAVWSEDEHRPFARALGGAGFVEVKSERVGGGGRRHVVFTGRRSPGRPTRARSTRSTQ
jgi:spermidine synthase